MDSTTGCESTGSTFTVLVTATKAGGIPLAVLLYSNQTAENYSDAFTLLKDNAQFCFGGEEVSHFIFLWMVNIIKLRDYMDLKGWNKKAYDLYFCKK